MEEECVSVSCVICRQKDAGMVIVFSEATLNKCRIALKIEGDCMPQTVLEAIKTGQTPGNNANNEDDERIYYDQEMFSSDNSTDEESEDSDEEGEN